VAKAQQYISDLAAGADTIFRPHDKYDREKAAEIVSNRLVILLPGWASSCMMSLDCRPEECSGL